MSFLHASQLRRMPSLDALKGFVAVAQRQSITLAAQDLCLSQSAVSRQVQLLEEQLQVRLLNRQHRSISLTPAGEQLLRLAAPWLWQLSQWKDSLQPTTGPTPVTVNAGIGVSSLWLLPRLGQFQEENPGISVRVAAINRLVDLVHEGVELGIRYCPNDQSPAGAVKLFDEHILPVKHPSCLATRNLRCLLELDERSRPWLGWSDWLRAAAHASSALTPVTAERYLFFNQYDQLIYATLAGQGIALGRLPLILTWLDCGELVVAEEFVPPPSVGAGNSEFSYWLVRNPELQRPELDALYEWLVQEGGRTQQQMRTYLEQYSGIS